LCSPQKLQETIHISGGVVTKYTWQTICSGHHQIACFRGTEK
jgi:hypothetical protein